MSNAKVRHRRRRRALRAEERRLQLGLAYLAPFMGRFDAFDRVQFYYDFRTVTGRKPSGPRILVLPPRTAVGRAIHEAMLDEPRIMRHVDTREIEYRMLAHMKANPDLQVQVYSGRMQRKR
jgi:hypothetical protein